MAASTRNKNRTNLYVDLMIAAGWLVAMSPRFTGVAIHEWLSLAATGAIVMHLLLHWQWVVATTRRFFKKLVPAVRINYVLNILLFISVTLAIFSGLMISEVILPVFGLPEGSNGVWRQLHGLFADASLWIVGGHIALHWKWVLHALHQYVIAPLRSHKRRPTTLALTGAEQ